MKKEIATVRAQRVSSGRSNVLSSRANSNSCKLELTCHPEDVFYKEEGGKSNWLFVFITLRTNEQVPAIVAEKRLAGACVPIKASLKLEDGRDCQHELGEYGESLPGESRLVQQHGYFNFATNVGSLRFRIEGLSRNHDHLKYVLNIGLNGLENVVSSCTTRGITVFSKRKWLKQVERSPELQKRAEVEKNAYAQCIALGGRLLTDKEAMQSFHVDVRTLFEVQFFEREYPKCKRSKDVVNDCRFKREPSEDCLTVSSGAPTDYGSVTDGDIPDISPCNKKRRYDNEKENDQLRENMNELRTMIENLDRRLVNLEQVLSNSSCSFKSSVSGNPSPLLAFEAPVVLFREHSLALGEIESSPFSFSSSL